MHIAVYNNYINRDTPVLRLRTSHLMLAAVRYFAVDLPCGRVIGVDVSAAGDELSPDEVLQHQVGTLLRGFGHN